MLLEVKKDGKTIPAIAVMNKAALLFILDRVTGKPIFGVTEKPVPTSPIASESASPTQPMPVSRRTGAHQLRPERSGQPDAGTHAACQKMIDDGSSGRLGALPAHPADHAIIRFPGGEGGPEWAGGAFDPKLGLFIVNTNNLGYVEKLVQQAGRRMGHDQRPLPSIRKSSACRARRRPGAC